MNARGRVVAAIMMVVIGLALMPAMYEKYRELTRPEQYQLIYQEGPRSWYLDRWSLEQRSEQETGIKYLDVTVKATYTFTTNVDYNKYWMRLDAREWQPISATGCDESGTVLEL